MQDYIDQVYKWREGGGAAKFKSWLLSVLSQINMIIIEKLKLRTDSIIGFPGHSPPGSTHCPAGQPSFTEQELVLTHQPHLY